MRIIVEVLDRLGLLGAENPFEKNVSKTLFFFTVWAPARYTKADPPNQADPADLPEASASTAGPTSLSHAPGVRMTVVKQTPSN